MAENNMNFESCSCNIIHNNIVNKVKNLMPADELLYDLAEFFKVFGDSTRIKILCALFEEEMCVCDISALLNISQSAVSHQLKILRQSKLVKYRKEGKVVYYSMADDHIKEIFNQGKVHIEEK
jgi:ArsR family transcriptional regulator, lead/cadmium/zinc/bismuth-responsive transcriptional repressor